MSKAVYIGNDEVPKQRGRTYLYRLLKDEQERC